MDKSKVVAAAALIPRPQPLTTTGELDAAVEALVSSVRFSTMADLVSRKLARDTKPVRSWYRLLRLAFVAQNSES